MKSRITIGCLVSLLLAFPSWSQTVTATLTGTVTDPHREVIPGAQISVTDNATSITRTTVTNSSGVYVVTALPPGHYRVVAERPGFKQAVVSDVELLVDQTADLNFHLQLGRVVESVVVNAAPPVVASETSSVSSTVDPHQMLSLPLNGRNFYDLVQLSPGVSPQMPNSFVAQQRPTPGGLNAPAFYVAGGRETSNGYLFDGIDAVDPHYLTPSVFPPVDSIQEFRLQTSLSDAEFGRSAAYVNVTTRSGSNTLHGSLYEFLRNDVLDAANYFQDKTGVGKAPLRYNKFGGTFGGPIVFPHVYSGRNRTFFFVSLEGTQIRQTSISEANVPTSAQASGDFSQLGYRHNQPIYDPSTTAPNPSGTGYVRQPFANNTIPQSEITPFAKAILALYPAPSTTAATGDNFYENLSDISDNDQQLFRIDHHFDDNNFLSMHYNHFTGTQTAKSSIAYSGTSTNVDNYNVALSYTHIFTTHALNELRLGYNRPTYLVLQDGAYDTNFVQKMGLQNLLADPIDWGVPNVSISDFSGTGQVKDPTTQVTNVYQLIDHLTLSVGNHSIRFGGEARMTNYNDHSEEDARGAFSFTGVMTANPQNFSKTGVSLADLMLGLPLTAAGTNVSVEGNFNGYTYAGFFQDDWRATPRLTLNLGLRYDIDTRFSDKQNRLTKFDESYPGGRLLIAGTSSAYIPGIGITPGPYTSRTLLPADKDGFEPRLGFAFRPFADDRTAIRTGFGIFSSALELQDLRTWVRNPPFASTVSLAASQTENSQSSSAIRVADLFPPALTPAALPLVYGYIGNYDTPYFYEYSLTIQHQVMRGTLLEIGYIGSTARHLAQRLNANQATLENPAAPTSLASRTPYPLFGSTIRLTDAGATSSYNGLIMHAERRFADGFSYLASFTYAKSLDRASLIDDQPRNIYDLNADYGPSDMDLRRNFVFSGSWELPFGKGKRYLTHSLPAVVAGGWQTNAIVNLRSGFPYSIHVSGDPCNCNAATPEYAQEVGNPSTGFTRSLEEWFNTSAFAVPENGTLGNSGRNLLYAPGVANVNFSVFREIPVVERLHFQFRAEAFNLFNHPPFSAPGGTVASSTYGQITSAGNSRELQLALKLIF